MYEQRFGLKTNPFRTRAQGGNTFVGPRQAKTITALQKALSGTDNVVTVTGPAGSGKTTIVDRALETNKAHQMVAVIGRMRLGPDEVLDLLLAGFGVNPQKLRTLQKIAAFQKILVDRANKNIRVVIVVEDALRIGNEALLELEALTASDGGNGGGANLILMGLPEVEKRLNFPELARLKQRARMAQRIAPFDANEVRGYLRQAARTAEADYDNMFAPGAAAMIYRCSEGIARVVDSLCDAALAAAVEENLDKVDRGLVERVAADVYGLEPSLPEPPAFEDTPVTLTPPSQLAQAPEAAPETNPVPETQAKSEQVRNDAASAGLPPVVAAALAAEDTIDQLPIVDESVEPEVAENIEPAAVETIEPAAAEKVESADEASDESLALPDLSELADIADDALIADTGMNVPPEFKPDPELDIAASQLAGTDDVASDPSDDASDDELPTLSTSMRVDILANADEEPVAIQRTIPAPAPADDEVPVGEFTAEPTVTIQTITAANVPDFPKTPDVEPAAETAAEAVTEPEPDAAPDLVPEIVAELPPEPEPAPETIPEPVEESEPVAELSPEPVAAVDPLPEPPTKPDEPPELEEEPKLEFDMAPGDDESAFIDEPDEEPVQATPEVPERRKPIPDLDALEAAISAARSSERRATALMSEPPVLEVEPAVVEPIVEPAVEAVSGSPAELPEITLDKTLEDQRTEGRKLDEMAEELAKAHSLEDISDIMAETLFGEEFEAFAAEALANPPAAGTLPGEDDVVASPVIAESAPVELPANDPVSESSPVALDPETPLAPEIDDAPPIAEVVLASEPDPAPPPANVDSIDEQFQTSITQTLKALKTRPSEANATTPEDDDKPGGLLGRLKRSFKG